MSCCFVVFNICSLFIYVGVDSWKAAADVSGGPKKDLPRAAALQQGVQAPESRVAVRWSESAKPSQGGSRVPASESPGVPLGESEGANPSWYITRGGLTSHPQTSRRGEGSAAVGDAAVPCHRANRRRHAKPS